MKKTLALLIFASLAHAQSVTQTITQLGNSNTWVLAFRWTADGSGIVPTTAANFGACPAACQGFLVTQVETIPGGTTPTNGYSVKVQDGAGVDQLGGSASSVSSTASQVFSVATNAPPIQGALSLVITGNSVASAKGVIYVFMSNPAVAIAGISRAQTQFIASTCNATPPYAAQLVNLRMLNMATQTLPCPLFFLAPGLIQPASGQTVTLSGTISAAPGQQIFDVSLGGTISVSSACCSMLYPNWWGAKGDGVTDDTKAMNASFAAGVASGIGVQGLAQTYLVNTASGGNILSVSLLNTQAFSFFGAGLNATTIKTTTAGAVLFKVKNASAGGDPVFKVGGFTLVGPDTLTAPPTCSGTTGSGDGLYLDGAPGAFVGYVQDVLAEGFCGSGKSAFHLNSMQGGVTLSRLVGTLSDRGFTFGIFTAGTTNNLTAQQNAHYGFYDIGSGTVVHNGMIIQSNDRTGYYCQGCAGVTWNSPHFENDNTLASASDHGFYLDSLTGGPTRGNVINGSSWNGPHTDIYILGNIAAATYGNVFTGGVSNSGPTPLVTEDGPEIGSNAFWFLLDSSRFSKVNNTTGRLANVNADIICGNYRATDSSCNITVPNATPVGTYSQITSAFPVPVTGQQATFTDSSSVTFHAGIAPGTGTPSAATTVLGMFNGSAWVVI